ncbi:MAG TPA: hypothetical protein VGN54_13690 [Mycobacteriales bacterium]|nr:hypothetical protein [Mycobacteriales bacterium]
MQRAVTSIFDEPQSGQLPPPPYRRRRLLVGTLALVVLAGLYVVVALTAALPSSHAALSLPAQVKAAGASTRIPLPATGQAALQAGPSSYVGGAGPLKPVPIGSVAKVMTALVVLRDHPLSAGAAGPELTVTAADEADYQSRAGSGQSLLPVVAGEQLSERQALEALLIPSANNIATLLARWDAGSVPAFIAKMTAAAAQIGLPDTRYNDPSGFDPGTVSTVTDQIKLATRALALPAFASVVAEQSVELPKIGPVANYNTLLGTLGVIGIKTGSTDAAGGNIVFAARQDVAGKTVTFVGAVLGADIGAPPLQALHAALDGAGALLAAAENQIGVVTALPAGAVVGRLTAPWGAAVPLVTSGPLRVVGWPGNPVAVTITASRHPSLRQGGSVAVAHADSSTAPVVAAASLPGPSLWWRLTHP